MSILRRLFALLLFVVLFGALFAIIVAISVIEFLAWLVYWIVTGKKADLATWWFDTPPISTILGFLDRCLP